MHLPTTYNRGVVQHVVFDRSGLEQLHECSSKAATCHVNSTVQAASNNILTDQASNIPGNIRNLTAIPKRVVQSSNESIKNENQAPETIGSMQTRESK